jgi:hypothetical protein
MRPRHIPTFSLGLAFLTPWVGACGDDPGGAGTGGASSSTATTTATPTTTSSGGESFGSTAAATSTAGLTDGPTPTTTDVGSSTNGPGSTTAELTGGGDSTSSTGPGCTPGERGCECVDGVCADGLACIDDVCAEPAAVCGDGQLDPPEMCEPREANCNRDCTYDPGLVFWTDIYSSKGADTMTTGARGYTAAFDADDVPYVGDQRYGEYLLGAGGWVLRYDHDTGAVDWQVRFTGGLWYHVWILGMSIQPDGSPVFGGQVNTGPEFGNDGIFGQVTPEGALGWGRQLEIVHTEWITDTATLADGAVIGVGTRAQDPDLPDRGWIVKVSATGLPEWQHDLDDGTDAGDSLQRIAAIDGDVVVLGCCEPGDAVFLRRYDPDGAAVWTTAIPGLDKPFFGSMGLAVDADDTIHVAWRTAAEVLWFGKFTADGDELWSASNDDPTLAGVYPRGLGVTPQGKLVVAGSRAGALVWGETVAGSFINGNDAFEDVAIDSRGLALIVGHRRQAGGQLGIYEVFVRMFAP